MLTIALSSLMLLQSFVAPPRARLENPAVVTPIPKKLKNDYDKLWTRFVNSKSAKDDIKVANDAAKLLQKNRDFPPLLLLQAYVILYRGQEADAFRGFSAALAADPRNRIALYYLAEMSFSRNDYASAADYYSQLFSVTSVQPDLEVKRQKAQLLAVDSLIRDGANAEAAGRLTDAEAIYRRALDLAPSEPVIHGLLASVLERQKNWEGALAEYRRQTGLAGATDDTQRHIIELLTTLGKSEEAKALSQRLGGSGAADEDYARRSQELEDLGRWGADIGRFQDIISSGSITREQLAALMVRYFPQIQTLSGVPQVVTDAENSWAQKEIHTVLGVGIVDLMANHTYQPARIVTRGEYATTLSRLIRIVGATPSDAVPIPTLIWLPAVPSTRMSNWSCNSD
jgi:tetratricopeptide (TPR) repeat protein